MDPCRATSYAYSPPCGKRCLKKIDSVQFLLNSFFPINDLLIPKFGRRLATTQQQVTKNTEL